MRKDDLKAIIHEKDGETFYWNEFLHRWENIVVRIQEWKVDECIDAVMDKFPDLEILIIDKPF